ncbi:MAG TPA: carboxypeptidase-like regulatory domain-containing protein [Blastocatellia bacterium]|nr:carboxypeptidase-like regulatory domain-containing protein [Blastocatellia bacterium]
MLAVILALLPVAPGSAQHTVQGLLAGQAAQSDSAAATRSGSKDERRAASGQKGSITGRVVSESGQGLMLAQVRANVPGGALNGNAFTATDEDGSFELGGLTPRAYTVTAFAPGYVIPRSTDGPTFYRPGDSVTIRMVKGGVITGTVTSAVGDPMVGVPANAIRVRDTEGKQASGTAVGQQNHSTDDRGIFRIYGLEAGVYLVRAGGQRSFPVTPLDRDVPTYYPSSTRDTAVEVSVRSGEETSGIDIRYRGEPGRAISGTVSGIVGNSRSPSSSASVMLYRAKADWPEATTYVSPVEINRSFAFYGVADGDYEVMAQRSVAGGDALASAPRRITVRGADVTGIDLALSPLGRITGRAVLEALPSEPPSDCKNIRRVTAQETVVVARRYEKQNAPPSHLSSRIYAVPDDKSNFSLNGVGAGSYHLDARLPGDGWYLKSVTSPPAKGAAPRKAAPASSTQEVVPISVTGGEHAEGLAVTFAEGAAALGGRATAKEGARLPNDALAYLVPVEQEYANAPWRYGESIIRPDGSFAFSGVAPGRYWMVAGKYQEEISPEGDTYRTAWSAASRKMLRQEAEATGQTVEIKPCQRITDYSFPYGSR